MPSTSTGRPIHLRERKDFGTLERFCEPLRVRHHKDLPPRRRPVNQLCQRSHHVGMQACFRLVQSQEQRRTRREERSQQIEEAQRPVRRLAQERSCSAWYKLVLPVPLAPTTTVKGASSSAISCSDR